MQIKDGIQTIEMLHRKYARVLYDKCLHMLGTRQDAEDAVQETFLNAHKAIRNFRLDESYLPWLYRIATNVCLKTIRARGRKGAIPSDKLEREPDQSHAGVSRLHYQKILQQMTDTLDLRNIEILTMHFLDGMKQEEVARAMGISRRAVVKRLTLIRKRLGEMLEEDDD